MVLAMKLTMPVKLVTDETQKRQLSATMRAFNQAATHAARVAFDEGLRTKRLIHNRCYRELREQFGLSSQMSILAIWKVAECFARDKKTCPQFGDTSAMTYDVRTMSFKGLDRVSILTLEGRTIVSILMGDYQAGYMPRQKGQCDLVYRDGEFYLYCTVDIPDGTPIEAERYLGVDLGIVQIAADSDGHTFLGTDIEAMRMRYATHKASFQATGTRSAKRRLKKMSGKESRFRRWVNHGISKKLVDYAKGTRAVIVLEDLTHIRQRVTVRKRQRNRHHSWSFSQLRQFIEYKALREGVPVVTVDPRNSSRTCSKCSYVDKRNRKSQAEFSCKRCGFQANADLNAARNLATRGFVTAPHLVTPRSGQLAFSW